jgi:hypothetical protein
MKRFIQFGDKIIPVDRINYIQISENDMLIILYYRNNVNIQIAYIEKFTDTEELVDGFQALLDELNG